MEERSQFSLKPQQAKVLRGTSPANAQKATVQGGRMSCPSRVVKPNTKLLQLMVVTGIQNATSFPDDHFAKFIAHPMRRFDKNLQNVLNMRGHLSRFCHSRLFFINRADNHIERIGFEFKVGITMLFPYIIILPPHFPSTSPLRSFGVNANRVVCTMEKVVAFVACRSALFYTFFCLSKTSVTPFIQLSTFVCGKIYGYFRAFFALTIHRSRFISHSPSLCFPGGFKQ